MHYDTMTVHLISDSWAGSGYNMDSLDKEMIHVPGGTEQMVQDFIMSFATAGNLKLMNCLFVELSI